MEHAKEPHVDDSGIDKLGEIFAKRFGLGNIGALLATLPNAKTIARNMRDVASLIDSMQG